MCGKFRLTKGREGMTKFQVLIEKSLHVGLAARQDYSCIQIVHGFSC
jgi:hypothetical protein